MKQVCPSFFVSLVEQTNDAVFVLRVEAEKQRFIIEYINAAYLRKFSHTAEELIGKDLQEILSAEKYQQVSKQLFTCVNNKSPLSYEETIVLGNQTLYSLSEAFPILDSNREVTHLIGLSKDITALKKHELEIQQHTEALREIAKIQSHEIRRPVANIIGLTEMIDTHRPQDLSEIVSHLRKSALELDEMIKHVITKTYNFNV